MGNLKTKIHKPSIPKIYLILKIVSKPAKFRLKRFTTDPYLSRTCLDTLDLTPGLRSTTQKSLKGTWLRVADVAKIHSKFKSLTDLINRCAPIRKDVWDIIHPTLPKMLHIFGT